jgi:SulP family sulfate permease
VKLDTHSRHSLFPAAAWLAGYQRHNLLNDTVAAVIVTMLLIPQSLAYALLAGLPAEMGLYACILPLLAYAAFGSSRTLSVGPVAVASLMTASAVGAVAAEGTVDYATAATTLALLGGIILLALGFLKFGFIANFLSHSVVSGFITASGIIIAVGQLGPLIGISIKGDTAPVLLAGLFDQLAEMHLLTFIIGAAAIGFLLFARYRLAALLRSCGAHLSHDGDHSLIGLPRLRIAGCPFGRACPEWFTAIQRAQY